MRWPVDVAMSGSLEAGTLLWTYGGALVVTLVLRTTYTLGAESPTLVAAGAVDREDRHYQGDPARAVRTAADLAPRIPRAEIVHAGAVIAPAGITVVRLALLRQGRALFDKRTAAHVKNDSTGLGPLGRAAPERCAALRSAAEPVPAANGALALPADFDFAFYQSAPPDQQVDRFIGGDQILLGNLHPELAELAVVVPARAPAARAILGSDEAPLVLEGKRILLDTDRGTFTMVWYGELRLPSFDAVPHLRIEARAPDALAPVVQPAPAFDARELLNRIASSSAPPPAALHRPAAGASEPPRVSTRAPSGTAFVAEEAQADGLHPDPRAPLARTIGTMLVDESLTPAPALPFAPTPPSAPRPPQLLDTSATPWAAPPIAPASPSEPVSPWAAAAPRSGSTPLAPPAPLAPLAPAAMASPIAIAPFADSAPYAAAALAPVAAPRDALALVWFDRKSVPRIVRKPAWQALLDALEDEPLDPEDDDPALSDEPAEVGERAQVFAILDRGKAAGFGAAHEALARAARKVVPPLELLEGELVLPFDEVETLKTLVSTVTPLATGDEALGSAVAVAEKFLATPGVSSAQSVADALGTRIRDALAHGKREQRAEAVGEQVERALLEQRHYQRRKVLGGPHLRGLLHTPGEEAPLVTYLPVSVADELPMAARFRVRVIAAVHPPVDEKEGDGAALQAVAVGRIVPVRRGQ